MITMNKKQPLGILAVFIAGIIIGASFFASPGANHASVEQPYDEDAVVKFNESFSYRGYTFKFEELEDPYVGRTWMHKNLVKLEPGRTASEIDETCNHELLHNWFPGYRHEQHAPWKDSIYMLEDKVDTDLCNVVTKTALEHGNPYRVEAELFFTR